MDNFTPLSEARQHPDLDLIRILHRGAGASVAFLARNSQGKLGLIGAASVETLDQHAGLIQSHGHGDLFFSLNSLGTGNSTTANGLQFALTKDTDTRYLNAVWVDLDIGRPDASGAACINVSEALQGIVDATHAGTIPQASAIIKSGRGVWVLWLLHDRDEPEQPPRAHDSNITRHRAICRELAARLEHIGADAAATNAARVCRVPGSMNCKSGQRVTWHELHNGDGHSASYSLETLAEMLDCRDNSNKVKNRTVRFFGRSIKSRGSAPARRRGCQARAQYRAQDIEKIGAARGGYRQGQRWHTLTIYAHQLKLSGATVEQITGAVETLAAACKPAFPSDASDGTTAQIVADAMAGTRNYSEAEIIKRLKVTPTEARRLELRSILPASVREERAATSKAANRTGQRETRLRALRAIVEATPDASASECQRQLSEQGIEAGSTTVKGDLLRLFPDRTPQPAGRPQKAPTQADEANPPSISKRFGPIKSEAAELPGVNIKSTMAALRFYQLRQGKDGRYNPAVVRKFTDVDAVTNAAYG